MLNFDNFTENNDKLYSILYEILDEEVKKIISVESVDKNMEKTKMEMKT